MKKTTVILFLTFIFSVPIINILTKDKLISEIENKILTQFPKISLEDIKNKEFMQNFDSYVLDQFPLRNEFIKFKNLYSYIIGQREFKDVYVSKNNRLLEKYTFNKEIIDFNLNKVNKISDFLTKNNIKSTLMVVPTSIAFYDDLLPSYAITYDQNTALKYIKNNTKTNFYTPYDILDKNKEKYIYFNTDHHWTQLGAYICYNDLYKKNENIYSNYKKVSDDFFGTYYSKALLPNIKSDSIYSYKNYNNFKIDMDFSNTYNTLYDENKLKGKNKYQYFLHGDPGFCIIYGNPNMNKEVLVFKDSFAHNFLPFLTEQYSKIHVIDPRYYKIDLKDYISRNKNISETLFLHNIKLLSEEKIYN